MKKQCMCYPSNESNNILQMKTTFKKTKKDWNKKWLSTHLYHCKSRNHNNYNKPHYCSKNYNTTPPPSGRQKLCHICNKKGH